MISPCVGLVGTQRAAPWKGSRHAVPFAKKQINRCNGTEPQRTATWTQCNIECQDIVILVAISPRSRQTTVASRRYAIEHNKSEPEAAMGTVMIKCPDTGRDIPTGIVADRE